MQFLFRENGFVFEQARGGIAEELGDFCVHSSVWSSAAGKANPPAGPPRFIMNRDEQLRVKITGTRSLKPTDSWPSADEFCPDRIKY
jgi:hypothetical protein